MESGFVPPVDAPRHLAFRWRRLPLFALMVALVACATGARDASYVYRSDDDFVRLVPIEPEAPPNDHPVEIPAEQLRSLLASVEVSRAASIGRQPVFAQEELETIVAPLASALSEAGPDQDVTFAVSSRRGMFGRVAPKAATTGRLFARDGSLNLIFGLMQEQLLSDLDHSTGKRIAVVPGTRSRRVGDPVWEIDPGRGELHERRGDWLMFDRSAIAAAGAAEAAPSGPDAKPASETPSKAEQIENRLRTLETLRERGVITEQEYRERRRAILEQL